MKESPEILRALPKAELLWASVREVLNVFQAVACGCHIVTVPHDILKKLVALGGKDLDEVSLDTVRTFHQDAIAAFRMTWTRVQTRSAADRSSEAIAVISGRWSRNSSPRISCQSVSTSIDFVKKRWPPRSKRFLQKGIAETLSGGVEKQLIGLEGLKVLVGTTQISVPHQLVVLRQKLCPYIVAFSLY
jgi:hypothetical protein